MIFVGGVCEGKVILVLCGVSVIVDGFVFSGIKVFDCNGFGICFERGNLIVICLIFFDSE